MLVSISPATLDKFSTFGDLLRFLRRRLGITQMELANAVGYSDAQISRLEQNLRPPDLNALQARFVPALVLEEEPKAVARLLELAATVRREDAPALGLCPYKGLNYFDEADADLFVGRETLSTQLVERVLALATGGPERFLAIVGASGSGKSSLVRAGMVAALRWNKTSADWEIYTLTPTMHPLESLAGTLTRENPAPDAKTALMEDLARDAGGLQRFAKRRLGTKAARYLLLVMDQFEELFALCHSEQERSCFIENLLSAAAEPYGSVMVVITLRADFYAHCASYVGLREALAKQQQYIGAMNDAELRRAIEESAQRGRWDFEPGLVDLLLHDVGHEPGALPLLSHALLETWQRRRGRMMTMSGYASSGGVRGAIAETAETVFTDQFTREQQAIARRIFLRLTEPGDETFSADTRRRATFSELILVPEEAGTTEAVLKALADARLITTSEDSAEVAHEALIREWPTLRGWVDENREGLRLHRQLTEWAQQWDMLAHDAGALYRGTRLAQAVDLAAATPHALSRSERAFLEASLENEKREEREREEARQRELLAKESLLNAEHLRLEQEQGANQRLRRRALFLVAALSLALFLAALVLFFGAQSVQNAQIASLAQATAIADAADAQSARVEANAQRDAARGSEAQAIRQQRVATSRELAASAITNLDVDPERSILLALKAVTTTYAVDKTTTKEALDALHRAIQNSRLRLTLFPNTGTNYGLAFSPDGRLFATGGENGKIKIWEFPSGRELFTLPGHDKLVESIAFSPDGTRLVSAGDDGKVKVWQVDTRAKLLDLRADDDAVYHVGYSKDGKRFVTTGAGGKVKIWDSATGQSLRTFTWDDGQVIWAEFSPDGTRVAAGGNGSLVQVWDVTSGAQVLKLTDNFDVDAVTFTPDGQRLITAGDERPRVWDATTGKLLFTLSKSKPGGTNGIAITPDGQYVAAGGQNGIAYVWNATTGQELATIATGSPIDSFLAISPGCVAPPVAPFAWCGLYLATGGRDRTVKFWDISPSGSREVLTVPGIWNFVGPEAERFDTITYQGSLPVTFSSHVWKLPKLPTSSVKTPIESEGAEVLSFVNAEDEDFLTLALAYSEDHTLSVSVNSELLTRIIDTTTGRELVRFTATAAKPPVGGATALALSPDNTRLAIASMDGTAQIWDVSAALKTGLGRDVKALIKLDGEGADLLAIRFSPDGKHLATTSTDNTARVWDVQTGKELLTLQHDDRVYNAAFSPNGTRLATSTQDGTAKIWDAATGRQLLNLTGHTGSVRGLAFSPDGKWLATGDPAAARIWDAMTGEQLMTLSIPSGVNQINFTSDGSKLVTSSTNAGISQVFLLDVQDLIALAGTRVTRDLTNAECQQYLHSETCPSPR